jgi:FXSXX-COOH protein
MANAADQQVEGRSDDYLADVAQMSIVALVDTDDNVLANALRRLAEEVVDPGETIAKFSNRP